jgi:DNA repair protein RadA/Sms
MAEPPKRRIPRLIRGEDNTNSRYPFVKIYAREYKLMTAKSAKTIYICTECGYESGKWNGKCPDCGAWNSFEESIVTPKAAKGGVSAASNRKASVLTLKDVGATEDIRYDTGTTELNRVLGGGLVKGSLVLLGGEPGIGKSTLLLQICGKFTPDLNILYISGEESLRQIKLRAERLGVKSEKLLLSAQNDADAASDTIVEHKPDIVIIDSIQTMHTDTANGSAGSISQVRECTNIFMHTAKTHGCPIILVGHVNKDGGIAGPKVMEHIVDTVLQFEGDRHYAYRLLRAIKNRFGSTNEIGVFEMTDSGLVEVENPSQSLLADRAENVSGNCAACLMEGSRPIITEVQALVNKSFANFPARQSVGLPFGRLNILLAVLERRAGLSLSRLDVFVNIIGGLRLDEPAGDLPLALAVAGAVFDTPLDGGTAAFGEIGLGGEIRGVANADTRIREAERLGFSRIIVPKTVLKNSGNNRASGNRGGNADNGNGGSRGGNIDSGKPGIKIVGVSNINEALKCLRV